MIRIVTAAALLGIVTTAFTAVIRVPDDYGTPQAAVNASRAGDEIVIENGTYDRVEIIGRENLTLTGRGSPVIGRAGELQGMLVSESKSVTLEGLTFGGDEDDDGLYVHGSQAVTVRKCRARGVVAGVRVFGSSDVVIERNRFQDTMHGILLLDDDSRKGKWTATVRHNHIHDALTGVFVNVPNARVEDNRMTDVPQPIGGRYASCDRKGMPCVPRLP